MINKHLGEKGMNGQLISSPRLIGFQEQRWELAPKFCETRKGCQGIKGPNPSAFLDKCDANIHVNTHNKNQICSPPFAKIVLLTTPLHEPL